MTTRLKNSSGAIQWAEKHGYKFHEVVDETSSAGDFSYIVSKDQKKWFFMDQTNQFPNEGFLVEIYHEPWLDNSFETNGETALNMYLANFCSAHDESRHFESGDSY